MRHFIFFLFFSLTILYSYSAPVTLKQAQNIASDFFQNNSSYKKNRTTNKNEAILIDLVYTPQQINTSNRVRSVENDPEFYIFTPRYQNGFVIIAGDDKVSSIIGYSFDQSFDTEKIPEALQEYLNAYTQYIREVRNGNIIPKTRDTKISTKEVKPLISTQWHTIEPFNYLNPNKYYPTTGIINMAQIMYYYKHPTKGNGIVSNSGQTIDLSESEYDWENMLNKYTIKDYDESTGIGTPDCSETEALAVARLARDCGFAINAVYQDKTKSANYGTNIAKALVQNFHYSPNIKTYARSNYNTQTWTTMIANELYEQRPIIYIASNSSNTMGGGFICDGIDSNNLFHINWGVPSNNGYFDLNSLNTDPDNSGIIGEGYNYTFAQYAILGIAPIKTGEDAESYSKIPTLTSDLIIKSQNNEKDNAEVTFSIPEIFNLTGYDAPGTLGIGLYKEGKLLKVEPVNHYELLANQYFKTDLNYSLDADIEYENGSYEIIPLWQSENTETWSLLNAGQTADRINMVVTTDKVTFSVAVETGDNTITVSIEPATDMDIYVNDSTDFICTIKNEFNKPLILQDLYLRFIPESQYKPGNTYIQMHPFAEIKETVLIYDKSSVKIKIKHAFNKSEKYRIVLDPYFWEGKISTKIIQENPPLISVNPVPDYPVLKALDKLNINSGINQYQASSIGGHIMASLITECAPLTGQENVALYARKKGGTAEEEFMLRKDLLEWDSNGLYITFGGKIPATDIEPGEYEVYLKYEENGVMTRLKPSSLNTGNITVEPSFSPILYLEAPVFTPDNNSIECLDYSEITVSLRSSLDFEGTIYLSSEDQNVYGSKDIVLKSGIKTEIPVKVYAYQQKPETLKITYWPFPDEKFQEVIIPEKYKESLDFIVSESKTAPVLISMPTVHANITSVSGTPVPKGVMIQGEYGYITLPIRSNKSSYSGNLYGICTGPGEIQVKSDNAHIGFLDSENTGECQIYFKIPNTAPTGKYELTHIYYEKNGQTDVWEEMSLDTPFYFDILSYEMITSGITGIENDDIRIIVLPDKISVQNLKNGQRLSVTNAMGSTIYNEIVVSDNVSIPVTNIGKGIYFVTVDNRTFKVLKN